MNVLIDVDQDTIGRIDKVYHALGFRSRTACIRHVVKEWAVNGIAFKVEQRTTICPECQAGPQHCGGIVVGTYPDPDNAMRSLDDKRMLEYRCVCPACASQG